jgi:hypothetical protein
LEIGVEGQIARKEIGEVILKLLAVCLHFGLNRHHDLEANQHEAFTPPAYTQLERHIPRLLCEFSCTNRQKIL